MPPRVTERCSEFVSSNAFAEGFHCCGARRRSIVPLARSLNWAQGKEMTYHHRDGIQQSITQHRPYAVASNTYRPRQVGG
jgi:hypothetical protein